VWLRGGVRTPPFSKKARQDVGAALRLVQDGHSLSMPLSRPMPSVGPRCHELRITDQKKEWRILYRVDPQEVLIVDVFVKKEARTPERILDGAKKRLARFDAAGADK
jgi:phage-related protein